MLFAHSVLGVVSSCWALTESGDFALHELFVEGSFSLSLEQNRYDGIMKDKSSLNLVLTLHVFLFAFKLEY